MTYANIRFIVSLSRYLCFRLTKLMPSEKTYQIESRDTAMELFLECLPCVLKQTLAAAKMNTNDTIIQEKIFDEALQIVAKHEKYLNSPHIVSDIQQIIKTYTGIDDTYAQIKKRDIKAALKALPEVQNFIQDKDDKMYWSLKAAATGNIIDAAIYDTGKFRDSLMEELNAEFAVCMQNEFEQDLKTAKTILIIGDNAGETVFDRLLIEYLDSYEVVYGVRSQAILNDATKEDAVASGLDRYCRIIDSGSTAPGTILDYCNDEFIEAFNNADIVISKGQGNYESLSDCSRSIYFALKAKCQVVADTLDVQVNDYVFVKKDAQS